MSVLKPVTIQTKSARNLREVHEFDVLRQEAIELLQQMAGDTWTDYNLHDPGVTIIEQLCFAITDLAYRTNFPIRDLLADESGIIDYAENSFFTREEILFSKPVTANDYRKILIDSIKEIDNIWLTPIYSNHSPESVKGIYRATVQLSTEQVEYLASTDQVVVKMIKERIRCAFCNERNLCEDLADEISILKPVSLKIQADVVIEDKADPEKVLAEIYFCLQQALANKVTYYTEQELINKGLRLEEIFSGPKLKNGFIPENELKPLRKYLYPNDLSQLISKIAGVLQVRIVTVGKAGEILGNQPYEIGNEYFPILDKSTASAIKLSTATGQVQIKQSVYQNLLSKLEATRNKAFVSIFLKNTAKEQTSEGKKNTSYYSIQHTFPQTYGIGSIGLPTSERTETRMGQVKQLKGYLLLFEQVLANYLANLTHIRDNFSSVKRSKEHSINHFMPVYNVPDLGNLLSSFTELYGSEPSALKWENFTADGNNKYIKQLHKLADEYGEYSRVKSTQLDHMLARFNVVLSDYPVKLSKQLYRPEKKENRSSEEINWKRYYLNKIVKIQQGEIRGLNITNRNLPSASFDFEKKIRLLLYIFGQNDLVSLSSVFDHNQLSFEQVKEYSLENKQDTPVENENWIQNGAQLFPDFDDATEIFTNRLNKRIVKENEFHFPNRSNRLFAEAIAYTNYKIIPDYDSGSDESFLILFKYPVDPNWDMISRHSSEMDAIVLLKKLVKYFRILSIESEGFYLLDHILLRPFLHTESFAYRLVNPENQSSVTSDWMTFNERENELQNEPTYKLTKRTKVELLTKGPDDQAIHESLFNFQLTMVLPSWPARFQDPNFKEYIREVVSVNLPANIKLTLRWLPPSKMKVFEADYLNWKISYADNAAERLILKHKLISFLILK